MYYFSFTVFTVWTEFKQQPILTRPHKNKLSLHFSFVESISLCLYRKCVFFLEGFPLLMLPFILNVTR